MQKLKLGVLVSGNGSNLQAILDACEEKKIDATVEVVISNNPKAFALQRAQQQNIPTPVITNGPNFEKEILKILKQHNVELVCLAGFMKLLSPSFIKEYPQRIINIHPALLPAFPGLHAQKRALESGAKITGATVHFVDEGCDTGPIILQSEVAILENDTEESLRERILKEEHKIYPEAIQFIATQSLKVVEHKVLMTKQTNITLPPTPSPSARQPADRRGRGKGEGEEKI